MVYLFLNSFGKRLNMLSRFVHIYENSNVYCYYHVIKNIPLYLSSEENISFNQYLVDGIRNEKNQEIINLFEENCFLIDDENDDENIIEATKKGLPLPSITTAYFVLSEDCNMACSYCFLGNAKKHFCGNSKMSLETAQKSFDFFINQTLNSGVDDGVARQIVFYGGEPLIGFNTLKYIIYLYNEYKKSSKIHFDIEFSIVTNGTLITSEIARYLGENCISVSLSLDGPTKTANENRLFKNGNPAFDSIISAIDVLNAASVEFGLSLTLSEATLSTPIDSLVSFLLEKNIMSVNLNTLLFAKEMGAKDNYHERAAQYIIDFWKVARENGIYEDRIMRKLRAFVNQSFYYSDCAATSGCQIVFAPNGQIGICHGNLESKKTFEYSLDSDKNLNNEPLIVRWTENSPILRTECQDCEAIGVCGGGCPLNATFNENKKCIIDSGFCIHTKKILEFMIWDLYSKMIEE